MYFKAAAQKVQHWYSPDSRPLSFIGLPDDLLIHTINHWSQSDELFSQHTIVLAFADLDRAEAAFEQLRKYSWKHPLYFFPGLEYGPHSGVIPSLDSCNAAFYTLQNLVLNPRPSIVVCPYIALFQKIPVSSFFVKQFLRLELSDIIAPDQLSLKLFQLGFQNVPSIDGPGTFSHKGEIFDIYPPASDPVRLHYFDDMIEEIFHIDKETLRTKQGATLEKIEIGPSFQIFCRERFQKILREKLPRSQTGHRAKIIRREEILESVSSSVIFGDLPYYGPLFLDEYATISEYFSKNQVIYALVEANDCVAKADDAFESMRMQLEDCLTDQSDSNPLPDFDYLYDYAKYTADTIGPQIKFNEIDVVRNLNSSEFEKIEIHLQGLRNYLSAEFNTLFDKKEFIHKTFELIKAKFDLSGSVIVCYQNESSKREIEYFLELLEFGQNLLGRIRFEKSPLRKSFFYEREKILFLSDSEFFSYKESKTKEHSRINIDLFAEQMASLKEGDYIVHSQHGVGRYLGLQSLNNGSCLSDFLIIEYKDGDKIYLPIYKMNLVQKFATDNTKVQVDNLKTKKFDGMKEKARASAKELAFDLIKLQAERQSSHGYAFSAPDHDYYDFELSFPFEETPDQRSATTDVLKSMQKPIAMDYLVCGDVGFGKTEIAMRAAFMAVLDKKQVCVLVPTTVLALQHYNSFCKRFTGFPVNIEFLSRFKSPKESKEIKEKLLKGEIDIIIGTHKVIAKTIKYRDLGLVVVDEEQRFGVGHKEQLKLLKSSVDFLTLTATPIPRTMQLAFLGLRDLSLIKTAPPKRQSIKTYLIKEDDRTLQAAIKKELSRDGQVFIVHNKVKDIEQYTAYISSLVPEAKIVYAHGQLSEKELEERMNAFYKGLYQILVSTTIIESGIDIPSANTMIVDRADTYGLSQLHQLRGRIGRSDRKAFAYFVIPAKKMLTPVAEKRLKALQTYSEIGSGFHIANCDLELRGAGNILGANQSGHIEKIGLELYTELLKDAIAELRGEKKVFRKDVEISTPFPCFIPANYINDSSERLKHYKVLSNCQDHDQISQLREEFLDIYGPLPSELENLLLIIEARNNLRPCGVKQIQVAGTIIAISFDRGVLDKDAQLKDTIIQAFMQKPNRYKFSSDYKVTYSHKREISLDYLLEYSREIAEQIVPC